MDRIMVVDDDPHIRFILKTMLSRAGYEIIEASGGVECLSKIRRANPNVLLLDIMMPNIDGWEVCKALKKDKATGRIPIVILSIRGNDEDKKKSLEYGADRHLTKPINFKEVLSAIKELT